MGTLRPPFSLKTCPSNRHGQAFTKAFMCLWQRPCSSVCQCLFYLWPKFYAGSWQPPCHSPLRRRRGGWWSSTALIAERSHGAHWRLESRWKCPAEATDSEHQSLNKQRLTWGHGPEESKVLNLSKQEKHEGVVRNAHWCCWFPWRRQRRDVGSAAGRRGGSSCWLKWAQGSWGCRGSCSWGGFRDRRCLQEIECISVQNKRPQVRFLLLTSS